MKLLSKDTLWLFLSASSKGKSEDRHILDVCFGIKCLETRKIQPVNIKLVIDGDKKAIKTYLKSYTKINYSIEESQNLYNVIKNIKHKNIVIFVTGHGDFNCGVDATVQMKPYNFIENLRNINGIENIVVYFGQCYAGIFNYVNVNNKPNTVLIGATNLYPSISLDDGCGWCANLFLYNTLQWIKNPVDIDGDGNYSVIDSFKYAGARTNSCCQNYKGQCLIDSIKLIEKINILKTKENKDQYDNLTLKEYEQKLQTSVNIHYNHQEPWILNANVAREIEF